MHREVSAGETAEGSACDVDDFALACAGHEIVVLAGHTQREEVVRETRHADGAQCLHQRRKIREDKRGRKWK